MASGSRSLFTNIGFGPHLVLIPPSPTDPLLTDLEVYALRARGNGSNKEPILLLHGHPQNSLIWHRVAPLLRENMKDRDIVIADLRGHGHSGVPKVRNFVKKGHEGSAGSAQGISTGSQVTTGDDLTPSEDALRARYSKREMARDMVCLMNYLGYQKFGVVGHDRGGRVAHRMAIDYPDVVTRIMTLDIVPTWDLYEQANKVFAKEYWHWFFLIQPYPTPEELILGSPKTYLDRMITRFNKKKPSTDTNLFPAEMMTSYLAQLSSPPRVHATCEDYRCSGPGGIDIEHDEADRKSNKKINQPFRALWGSHGVNQLLFGDEGPIRLWQNVCSSPVTGRSIECGHYMPEEAPAEIADDIVKFFI